MTSLGIKTTMSIHNIVMVNKSNKNNIKIKGLYFFVTFL